MSEPEYESLEAKLASEMLGCWVNADEQPPSEAAEADRRGRPRADFPYVQLLAPVEGGRFPREEDLQEVRCQDISASGFAYYDFCYPSHKEVVVGFGPWAQMLYLQAEVVHVTPTIVDGEYMFIIGCRYTKRVELRSLDAGSAAARQLTQGAQS